MGMPMTPGAANYAACSRPAGRPPSPPNLDAESHRAGREGEHNVVLRRRVAHGHPHGDLLAHVLPLESHRLEGRAIGAVPGSTLRAEVLTAEEAGGIVGRLQVERAA